MKSFVCALAFLAAGTAAPAAVFDCVMDPAVVVSVGSPVTGLLEEVVIDRGQQVAKGDVIARLHAEMEDAAIRLMELQAANEDEIAVNQVRLDLAKRRQARVGELSSRGVATEEQFDEVNATVGVAARELALAQIRRDVLALELERARTARDQKIVRSPINGLVIDRPMYDGEFVTQESHIATIAQLDPLYVEAYLPVSMYPQIARGQTATVRPNAPVGGAYEAQVVVVDQVFDAASGTFGVRLALPNPGSVLPAGHRCTVVLGADDG
ncbi:MAG: efflux RND transporter periplasmic adaptor subunit [Rhodobacteraceae bacterium]|nr:efflux RND transporter periplasmic adaptor subunit [Paracoccaceae bacterium]